MQINIYQINLDRDHDRHAFESMDDLERYHGSKEIDSSVYDMVYEGEVDCAGLEDVFQMFNLEHPEIAWLVSNYFYYCFAGGDEDSMDVHIRSHWGEKGIDWNYPEPGTTGMFSEFGFDAGLEVINKVWGLPTDKQWQNSSFVIVYAPDIMEVWDGNVDNDEYQYAVNYGYNHDHAPDEADLVPKLHYTAEEVDQWNEPRTALKTYISESRTLFAVGQMDPNNDTDWQNYLSELEKLQYKEILAVDQEAYDRVYGK